MNNANFNIACIDVYYYNEYAKASCIVFVIDPFEKILSTYSEIISPVNEYISGEFYKRELPCILKVLNKINLEINLIIIDGYVYLSNNKKGLGAYLYDELKGRIPVIGVAKTYFKDCQSYAQLYRGKSKKTLYISSIGIDLNFSANLIKNLNGHYRIPDILRKVDSLSKELK